MPIYKIELNETKPWKDGTYSLVLAIRLENSLKKFVIGAIPSDDWNPTTKRVKKTNPNATALNRHIKTIDTLCHKLLVKMFTPGSAKRIEEISDAIRAHIKN